MSGCTPPDVPCNAVTTFTAPLSCTSRSGELTHAGLQQAATAGVVTLLSSVERSPGATERWTLALMPALLPRCIVSGWQGVAEFAERLVGAVVDDAAEVVRHAVDEAALAPALHTGVQGCVPLGKCRAASGPSTPRARRACTRRAAGRGRPAPLRRRARASCTAGAPARGASDQPRARTLRRWSQSRPATRGLRRAWCAPHSPAARPGLPPRRRSARTRRGGGPGRATRRRPEGRAAARRGLAPRRRTGARTGGRTGRTALRRPEGGAAARRGLAPRRRTGARPGRTALLRPEEEAAACRRCSRGASS